MQMYTNIIFSDDELTFIKERYPNVDMEDLSMPALGMLSVTSFELLKSSVKSDVEYMDFEDCDDPLSAIYLCNSIERKLDSYEELLNEKDNL